MPRILIMFSPTPSISGWNIITRIAPSYSKKWQRDRPKKQCEHPEPSHHSHKGNAIFVSCVCLTLLYWPQLFNVPAHSANRHSGNLRWVEWTCSHPQPFGGSLIHRHTWPLYVQHTVTKQLQQDEIPYLVPNGFTIARADNLDFQQPQATVYSGDQSQSWHGTTMQLVQPRPHSLQNPHPTPTGDRDYIATLCRLCCA